MFKRKVYSALTEWKEKYSKKYAAMLEGARRVGKSTVAEEFAVDEGIISQSPKFLAIELVPNVQEHCDGRCVYERGVTASALQIAEKNCAVFFVGQEIFFGVGAQNYRVGVEPDSAVFGEKRNSYRIGNLL